MTRLRVMGKLRKGRYPDGTVYYRFNGVIVNSIEIMRLAGMTKELHQKNLPNA